MRTQTLWTWRCGGWLKTVERFPKNVLLFLHTIRGHSKMIHSCRRSSGLFRAHNFLSPSLYRRTRLLSAVWPRVIGTIRYTCSGFVVVVVVWFESFQLRFLFFVHETEETILVQRERERRTLTSATLSNSKIERSRATFVRNSCRGLASVNDRRYLAPVFIVENCTR